MSCNLIETVGGHKVARPIKTEQEYREIRNSSVQLANLRQARSGNAAAKGRLVQMNYSGHYPNGAVKGTKLPADAFGFDLDDREEFERVATLLLASPEAFGLLMLERSASQGGHAVFRRERGKTILENQVRIASELQCEMDTSAHDINRVYFSTTAAPEELLFLSSELFTDAYDEAAVADEARVLEERERYGREELPPGAHKANKHYRPWAENCGESSRAGTDPAREETVENSIVLENQGDSSTDGPDPAVEKSKEILDACYLGIPYASIIAKWWELYNDGKTPVKSNRDVLTFELAVNLRHICGFDRAVMDAVIPCYDGFPHEQKMKCIDSALAEKRTQMPRRLRDVLTELKKDNVGNDEVFSAIEEAEQEDDLYYYKRLSRVAQPLGIRESIKSTGPKMAIPVISVCCPMIGALATNVKVKIHGKVVQLNIHAFVVGEAASNKGDLDAIVDAWMVEQIALNALYFAQEQDYRNRKRQAKNKKEQPEEPHLPVRFLTMNNTVANLAERLANCDGKHAFSFTPEADTVAAKWRSSMCDFSTMLRQAYDGSRYDREAKSADATTVHIDHLLWNVCMCGTPDALYRVISNYTDGLLSRFVIAHTPDNTFAPLEEKPYLMTDALREKIGQVAHLLPFMQGTLDLPKLEERSRQWVERLRRDALKDDDRVRARARLRDHGTAMRMVACLILCAVAERLIKQHGLAGAKRELKQNPNLTNEMAQKCQTPAMLEAYDVLADSLIENDMLYFRDKLECASGAGVMGSSERQARGKNDRVYDRLSEVFNFEQAMGAKGNGCSRNAVKQMLKNWHNQGLIEYLNGGRYQKIATTK
ncbi:MAG: DUF3987 domain-containing protein [Bacteroidales bacterium]|nr:DUF3987 domain-containing protein [Bacteroidales bacterium]